jgi:hypothetical protein
LIMSAMMILQFLLANPTAVSHPIPFTAPVTMTI